MCGLCITPGPVKMLHIYTVNRIGSVVEMLHSSYQASLLSLSTRFSYTSILWGQGICTPSRVSGYGRGPFGCLGYRIVWQAFTQLRSDGRISISPSCQPPLLTFPGVRQRAVNFAASLCSVYFPTTRKMWRFALLCVFLPGRMGFMLLAFSCRG